MVPDQSMGGVRSRHLGICPTARFSRHRIIRRGQGPKNLRRTSDIRENLFVKASIAESAVSDIRTALTRLPPPKPADRMLCIDEATTELYDDLRASIIAGHSIKALAETVLAPAGWAASAERIRRALLEIARQRRDRDLANRIGGLRPRRHRASDKTSATTPRPMPPKPVHGDAATKAVLPTTVSFDNKSQLLALE